MPGNSHSNKNTNIDKKRIKTQKVFIDGFVAKIMAF